MENILNPEIIRDKPNFYKFVQIYEYEEYQYVSFTTES